ncbi:hypothetical protein NHF50_05080 [Flavobacterium sp. NRK F10]|uniref:hypothetical protein n=1 Tax=Flavobacterium sp. NRK F10 TaxID=2954931 RepID=UPI002091ABE7|nr:hypothetical protein [Flavobacterium sp. NRK F10]MCO6174412.1 hypothetical protein [Flavobacterium sp. NRK F10]
MNILKSFRKPYISLLFALSILFVSCSQQDDSQINQTKISTFKMANNGSTNRLTDDFYIDLEANETVPTIVNGEISAFDELLNVEMDISSGIEINNPVNISDNEIQFYSNGELLKYKILNSDKTATTIRFETTTVIKDFIVDGQMSFAGFSNYYSTTSPTLDKACPPCAVVGVVVVVGGAYCLWKQHNASSTCLAAYQACVSAHGNCSYQFQSSSCGGTCNVNPH